MATDRRAEVTWQGSLMEGSGTIVSTTSGAIGEQPVSWPNRAEDAPTRDEPRGADRGRARRVLLDGALGRARAGRARRRTSSAPRRPSPSSRARASREIALTVEGTVPGLDADGFAQAAQTAKENCPVSKALAGVPEISLEARLALDASRMAADFDNSSRSSSARTRSCRRGCPTRPSTTTTARRRTSAGA